MDLCDAINKAIEDFGKDILSDGKRLFNILSDYQAFDNKAYRRAMDTLLSIGFGRQLYLLFDKTESERQVKIKSFISEIESEGFASYSGVQNDIYVLRHLSKTCYAGVLAHEMLHLWQNKNGLSPRRDICEGFCNLGSFEILKSNGTQVAISRISALEQDPDPI